MIKGIGIELIELERIKASMEKQKRFVDRIITEKEKKVWNKLENNHRKTEFLAGRFAANETYAKTTGRRIGKLSFKHIEVLGDENGAPILKANGYETASIFISITHSRDYAVAQVVIEAEKQS